MLRAFGLMLLALAITVGHAQAQVVDVPKTYPIPLPPMSNPEPQWELGLRYWYSEGSKRFDINSQLQNPFLGNPTSTLTYDGIDANSLEFVFAVRNETRTFFKGFVGGGWLDNGSLDDEDFFAGQIKFSDTYSQLDGDGMVYGTMDVGQDFTLIDRKARVVLSPFVGFNYWEESVDGYGARCNRDDVGGLICGPPAPPQFRSAPRSSTTRRTGRRCGWAPSSKPNSGTGSPCAPTPPFSRSRISGTTTATSCARISAPCPISRTAAPAGATSSKASSGST